jgi:hypothetical protein
MQNNPLSSLATPEEKRKFDKFIFHSYFYLFKQKKLNRVGNCVKEILGRFNIDHPIIFDLKYPCEGSKYGIALIDSTKYDKYKIFIHYNPRLITMEFDQLVFTGLHEYCHIIYRQRQDFSKQCLQQIFSNVDYEHFIESVDYLTKVFVQKNILNIPSKNNEMLKDRKVIEESFAEGFASYLAGSQTEIYIEEKKHFETIVDAHNQIMRGIRHLYFGELYND